MTPPPAPETELLDRYLANECTPVECALVDAWAASPEHALRLTALRRAVTDPFGPATFSAHDVLSRRVWNSVDAAEQGGDTDALHVTDTTAGAVVAPRRGVRLGGPRISALRRRTPSVFSRWGVALVVSTLAAVVLLIAVGGRRGPLRSGVRGAMSTYTTTDGERANITLPDGSTVMLNVASRLDVPADYAAGDRTVHLTGEALFTVTHHDGVPFTVVAGGTTARVLGTTFKFRHYAADTTTVVAVQDGKVMVHAGAIQSVVLTAARAIKIGPRGVAWVGEADRAMFDFALGILTIHSTPLVQVIPELDRWYNADVRLGAPSFAQVPIEGKFTAGSLSDLGDVLGLMLHAHVVRNGRVLTLYPRAR